MLGHADRGDDRIDREDQVDDDDLRDDHAEVRADLLAVAFLVLALDVAVDLARRLDEQEEPAGEQDQVAPGEAVAERDVNSGVVRLDQPEQREQEDDAEDERQRQADLAGPLRLIAPAGGRRSPR